MSEARKAKLTEDLTRFYAYKRVPFDKPSYKPIQKLPFVPSRVKVDHLISSCGKKVAAVLVGSNPAPVSYAEPSTLYPVENLPGITAKWRANKMAFERDEGASIA